MSGRIGLLGFVLALQLALIGLLLLRDGAVDADAGPLLAFAADAVDRIEIADGEGGRVVIERAVAGWQLDTGVPADPVRVDELLGRLADLRAAWPVATTASAAERFEVAPAQYQRHVRLLADGEPVAEAYFGTSPGYQRVHARRSGDDAVYGVALSNFQVPARADEWLDRALLRARGDIASIEREGSWRLDREDEGWLVDGAAADQDQAAALARRFAELRVSGVADAGLDGFAERAVFRIEDAEGPYRLTLHADGDAERYVVRSDRRDGAYMLPAYTAEQLLLEAAALAADEPAPSDEAS